MTGEMSWGGVDLLTHRYIGNVRNDVTADMIVNDLKARDIDVVSVEENVVTKHTRYKSFKLSVKRADTDKVDDAGFWPSNVVVRRWWHPRQPRNDGDGAAGAVLAS